MKDFKIALPYGAKIIIDVLSRNGYEAYVVGGCVRDSLLGRTPGDWDLTTDASPDAVKALFHKTIDTGIEHGTVTVMIAGTGYEVTTYRVDGDYRDHRHPDKVVFTRSLLEDQKRRDFTINAMAYNDQEGLKDAFGGAEDLEKRLIRCVGNPRERFDEDALRILRAVRFSAQLGFAISEETQEAAKEAAATLSHVSAERIQVELTKMLLADHPESLLDAYALGITKVVLPEFDLCMATAQETPHHKDSVGRHTVAVIKGVPNDRVLRLAALFHDMGKPHVKTIDQDGVCHFKGHAKKSSEIAENVLRRLRFDNDTIRNVCRLVAHHEDYYKEDITPEMVRRMAGELGKDLFPKFLLLKKADILAQSTYKRAWKCENLQKMETFYRDCLANGYAIDKKDLAVKGRDLIKAGIRPGKQMGEILDALMDEVLTDPEKNTKSILLERALVLEKHI